MVRGLPSWEIGEFLGVVFRACFFFNVGCLIGYNQLFFYNLFSLYFIENSSQISY